MVVRLVFVGLAIAMVALSCAALVRMLESVTAALVSLSM